MSFKVMVDQIKVRKLFLIDSLGALLSAATLGLILTRFEQTFGMPHEVLYYLAGIACLLSIYSFICYSHLKENWRPYLKIIGIANLTYCCLTIVLVIFLFQKLTALGLLYFILEIIIVTILIIIELKTSVNLANNKEKNQLI